MYYIVYGLLYVFSLLPLKVLYLFSDIAYFFFYPVFGYRKKVVMANLMQAFPEKTEKERIAIAKKFYKNLFDMFLETIKMISVSDKFIAKRFHCKLGIATIS
jgi:KDO2-lipid IV(A) lauroyltransferase